MNLVITIGRQFGSGGHEVGARLAKKLGIPLYDKTLLSLTAKNSRFAESFLEKVDEQKPGFLGFGAAGISLGSEAAVGQFYQMNTNDQAFVETSKTIHKLAEKGPCVIVGRCADYVLHDVDTVDLFIFADMKDRVARKLALLPKDQSMTEEEMEKLITTTDKNRAKYYEYYAHENWGEASHYDMCINTSHVGVDAAVEIIANYVESFGKKGILPDKR